MVCRPWRKMRFAGMSATALNIYSATPFRMSICRAIRHVTAPITRRVMLRGTRLLPGAREVLAAAQKAGMRLGVCSNKPRLFTKELLDFLDIGQFIDAAFGPEDVARPKPAPDMLLKALDWLGVAPSDVLYVGDMVVDIETALLAGVTVWVVATGSDDLATLEAAGPDRILRDLQEMMPLFCTRANEEEPRTK